MPAELVSEQSLSDSEDSIINLSREYFPETLPLSSLPKETSSDEERAMDPSDFLSPKPAGEPSREGLKGFSSTTRELSHERFNFSRESFSPVDYSPSIMSWSEFPEWPQNESNHDLEASFHGLPELPMVYLASREKKETKRLEALLLRHHLALQTGEDDIDDIRQQIAAQFSRLHEVYVSLGEIYKTEILSREEYTERIKHWEARRNRLIQSVDALRDTSGGEGAKLVSLLAEQTSCDDEIAGLESQLRNLRLKRAMLGREIVETNSVIESRCSLYLESLASMEEAGLKSVQSIPLFMNGPELIVHLEKAFISLERSLNLPKMEPSIKNTLMGLWRSVKEEPEPRAEPVDLIIHGKIVPKVDVNAILEVLHTQTEVYNDMREVNGSKGEGARLSLALWATSVDIVHQMEAKVRQITGNDQEAERDVDKTLLAILNVCYDELEVRVKLARGLDQVTKGIMSECEAVSMGIQVISRSALSRFQQTKAHSRKEVAQRKDVRVSERPGRSLLPTSISQIQPFVQMPTATTGYDLSKATPEFASLKKTKTIYDGATPKPFKAD
ncbi:hypothetical protein BABINDRAFT_100469 [Babjeviella inositovora NRRL Y-12698]|uniref:Uncharacterized protein n=1 Tax=Babjeviella inositovora NRRL Y-12698 TaxID=984486 RepID=A0A1E3QJT6_9ASCO|nr:uncharacterized protein BABINDRAFT_100469 [Babjeviella inositovora NRRL Y-12698]ODQ77342.1 hypothetical protein BABINDRAFT_100469 [Babjeviella inositovora NRRL Y-12698]